MDIECDTCEVKFDKYSETPEFAIVTADFSQCMDCYERDMLEYFEHRDAGY